jgi:hypothetical protein
MAVLKLYDKGHVSVKTEQPTQLQTKSEVIEVEKEQVESPVVQNMPSPINIQDDLKVGNPQPAIEVQKAEEPAIIVNETKEEIHPLPDMLERTQSSTEVPRHKLEITSGFSELSFTKKTNDSGLGGLQSATFDEKSFDLVLENPTATGIKGSNSDSEDDGFGFSNSELPEDISQLIPDMNRSYSYSHSYFFNDEKH